MFRLGRNFEVLSFIPYEEKVGDARGKWVANFAFVTQYTNSRTSPGHLVRSTFYFVKNCGSMEFLFIAQAHGNVHPQPPVAISTTIILNKNENAWVDSSGTHLHVATTRYWHVTRVCLFPKEAKTFGGEQIKPQPPNDR